ncbi:MAG: band 7 protein [Planctomycetaceae bacterium]|nr:band 7 protein [Planctomycetaceae bacterium]
MSVDFRRPRRLISLMIGVALLAALGFEVFQWTYCYWYVENGKSLLLTYKGLPLPILGFNLEAAPEGQLAEVDEDGRPKQKGILAEMVGPGRHFYFPLFWECEKVPDVLVEPGSVAIVISRVGKKQATGQFLVDGDIGQTEYRGTMRKLLGPGRYRINPKAYEVTVIKGEEVKKTEGQEKRSGWVLIKPGYVGVVTNLTDNPLTKAVTGIQNNVLPPGLYPINKEEQQVDVVKVGYREKSIITKLLTQPDGIMKLDQSGEPTVMNDESGFEFKSDDGFQIRIDFTAIWGIMPDQAADLIRKFGDEDAVEDKVVMPQIESICQNHGRKLKAAEFLDGKIRQTYQDGVSKDFAEVLDGKGLSVLYGLVRNIYIPQEVRLPIQQGYIADELKITREQQQLTAMTEADLREAEEKVKLQTEQIRVETEKLVAAKLAEGQKTAAETIAETTKKVAAIASKTAEIDKDATVLLGTAKAKSKTLSEEAKAEKFQLAVEAFGSGQAYNQWVFAQGLPADLELNLIYSGEGTLWTDLKGFGDAMLGKQSKQLQGGSPQNPIRPGANR